MYQIVSPTSATVRSAVLLTTNPPDVTATSDVAVSETRTEGPTVPVARTVETTGPGSAADGTVQYTV